MGACWLRAGTAKHRASKADSAADRRTGVGKGTCMTSPQRKRLCTPASEGVRDEGKESLQRNDRNKALLLPLRRELRSAVSSGGAPSVTRSETPETATG